MTSTGVERSTVVPSPSCPLGFQPQHLTAAVRVTAQVWRTPTEIDATPLLRPTTSTGVERSTVVPSPSWPRSLEPQHLTPPALVSAQPWRSPPAIAVTPLLSPGTSTAAKSLPQHWTRPPLVNAQPTVIAVTPPLTPETSTGVERTPAGSGYPPQHLMPPALVSAQLRTPPAATAVTPLPRPETSTGAKRRLSVPSPSAPEYGVPQHLTPPAPVTAQLWRMPAAMAATPARRPETSTGVELFRLVPPPSPSSSWPLKPQHLTPPALVNAQLWTAPAATAVACTVADARSAEPLSAENEGVPESATGVEASATDATRTAARTAVRFVLIAPV